MRIPLIVAVTVASVLAATPAQAAAGQAPDQPTGLGTSPATECAANPPALVGIGDVTLTAPVTDPDGGILDVTIELWNGPSLVASPVLPASSGSFARYRLDHDQLEAVAAGEITPFSWRARAADRDGNVGPWSDTCSFRYDPTRTTAPVVSPPGATQIGKPITLTVAKGPGGVVPTRYGWRLNSSSEHGVVTADANGAAVITVTPRRFLNDIEVYGLSVAGNVGASTRVSFDSDAGDVAAEGDLTGDGHTDLLVAGGAHNLPTGLWLATGDGAGHLAPAAVDLDPTDFAGTGTEAVQVSLGRFTGGSFQDVLAYQPGNGGALVFRGMGDGTPIRAANDVIVLSRDLLADRKDRAPLQLVRAATAPGQTVPDLIGTAGSPTAGYYLNYYPSNDWIAGYLAHSLTTPTPAGDRAWNTWTLASSATTLFLWQKSTGTLYAWHNVTFDQDTETLSYTEQHLSDSFNTGQPITLRAADINGDDTSDLWTVGPNASATPWLITPAGTMTAGPAQPITAP